MTIPKPFLQIVAAVVFIHGCAAGPTPRSAPATLESEIRERSRLLAAAEAAKDFETAVSFWMPDAVIHLEGAETIRGLSAIRDTYEHFFKTVLSFRGKDEDVAVAASGDLAYETGTNYMTLETPSGPTAITSKYVSVWKRGSDGQWRVALVSLTNNPTK